MANAREAGNRTARQQLRPAIRQVGPGHGIRLTVHEHDRYTAGFQRADPALPAGPAFRDIAKKRRHDFLAVTGFDEIDQGIQLALGRAGFGPKDALEAAGDLPPPHQPDEYRPQWAGQQGLNPPGPVGLGKQAAVEKQYRAQACQRGPSLGLPSQQFLGHRVAIVVGENVKALKTGGGGDRLTDIGLDVHVVGSRVRFGGVPETQQVRGGQAEIPAEVGPDPMPVPGGGREPMDQQDRIARGALAVPRNPLTPDLKQPASGPPAGQGLPVFAGIVHNRIIPLPERAAAGGLATMPGSFGRSPERGKDVTDNNAPETGKKENQARVQEGIRRVIEALQNGQAQDALAATRELLEQFPNEADPYQMLGFLLLKGGRPDQAVEALSRSIDIDDGYPGAHYNLGLALTALGRLDEAVAAHGRVIGLNPDHRDAHGEIAKIHEAAGRHAEAEEAWRRVLALAADDVAALAGVARSQLATDRAGDALATLDAALAGPSAGEDLAVLKSLALEAAEGPAAALAWAESAGAEPGGLLEREVGRLSGLLAGGH